MMDSLYAIGMGLGIRVVVGVVSKQDFRVGSTLVGLWEGVVLYHFVNKMPSSSDPYIAYCVRLFVDFLFTESITRMAVVVLWTGMGMVLSELWPAFWYDTGLRHIYRQLRRDLSLIRLDLPSIPSMPSFSFLSKPTRAPTSSRVRFHERRIPIAPSAISAVSAISAISIVSAPSSIVSSISADSESTATPGTPDSASTITQATVRRGKRPVPGFFPDDVSESSMASSLPGAAPSPGGSILSEESGSSHSARHIPLPPSSVSASSERSSFIIVNPPTPNLLSPPSNAPHILGPSPKYPISTFTLTEGDHDNISELSEDDIYEGDPSASHPVEIGDLPDEEIINDHQYEEQQTPRINPADLPLSPVDSMRQIFNANHDPIPPMYSMPDIPSRYSLFPDTRNVDPWRASDAEPADASERWTLTEEAKERAPTPPAKDDIPPRPRRVSPTVPPRPASAKTPVPRVPSRAKAQSRTTTPVPARISTPPIPPIRTSTPSQTQPQIQKSKQIGNAQDSASSLSDAGLLAVPIMAAAMLTPVSPPNLMRDGPLNHTRGDTEDSAVSSRSGTPSRQKNVTKKKGPDQDAIPILRPSSTPAQTVQVEFPPHHNVSLAATLAGGADNAIPMLKDSAVVAQTPQLETSAHRVTSMRATHIGMDKTERDGFGGFPATPSMSQVAAVVVTTNPSGQFDPTPTESTSNEKPTSVWGAPNQAQSIARPLSALGAPKPTTSTTVEESAPEKKTSACDAQSTSIGNPPSGSGTSEPTTAVEPNSIKRPVWSMANLTKQISTPLSALGVLELSTVAGQDSPTAPSVFGKGSSASKPVESSAEKPASTTAWGNAKSLGTRARSSTLAGSPIMADAEELTPRSSSTVGGAAAERLKSDLKEPAAVWKPLPQVVGMHRTDEISGLPPSEWVANARGTVYYAAEEGPTPSLETLNDFTPKKVLEPPHSTNTPQADNSLVKILPIGPGAPADPLSANLVALSETPTHTTADANASHEEGNGALHAPPCDTSSNVVSPSQESTTAHPPNPLEKANVDSQAPAVSSQPPTQPIHSFVSPSASFVGGFVQPQTQIPLSSESAATSDAPGTSSAVPASSRADEKASHRPQEERPISGPPPYDEGEWDMDSMPSSQPNPLPAISSSQGHPPVEPSNVGETADIAGNTQTESISTTQPAAAAVSEMNAEEELPEEAQGEKVETESVLGDDPNELRTEGQTLRKEASIVDETMAKKTKMMKTSSGQELARNQAEVEDLKREAELLNAKAARRFFKCNNPSLKIDTIQVMQLLPQEAVCETRTALKRILALEQSERSKFPDLRVKLFAKQKVDSKGKPVLQEMEKYLKQVGLKYFTSYEDKCYWLVIALPESSSGVTL